MESPGAICLTLLLLCAAGFPLRAAFLRLHVPPALSLMALGVIAGPSSLAQNHDRTMGMAYNLGGGATE